MLTSKSRSLAQEVSEQRLGRVVSFLRGRTTFRALLQKRRDKSGHGSPVCIEPEDRIKK